VERHGDGRERLVASEGEGVVAAMLMRVVQARQSSILPYKSLLPWRAVEAAGPSRSDLRRRVMAATVRMSRWFVVHG
jgi:hypothetical protein